MRVDGPFVVRLRYTSPIVSTSVCQTARDLRIVKRVEADQVEPRWMVGASREGTRVSDI